MVQFGPGPHPMGLTHEFLGHQFDPTHSNGPRILIGGLSSILLWEVILLSSFLIVLVFEISRFLYFGILYLAIES